VKKKPFPTLALQQNSRSRGAPGEPITMLSMGFGGEKEATMILGVRRKKDLESAEATERAMHANTITLHLVKNKRPPGKVTPIEGVDFEMVPSTGLIRPLQEDTYVSYAQRQANR
jgi:hypothetical protein